MTTLTDLTPEKIKEICTTYIKNACNISRTCAAINISRLTWYNWKEKHEDSRKAVQEAEDSLIDEAETQLLKNIRNGKEVSLIFFLKNKKPDAWKDRRELGGTLNMKMIKLD